MLFPLFGMALLLALPMPALLHLLDLIFPFSKGAFSTISQVNVLVIFCFLHSSYHIFQTFYLKL